MGPTCEVLLESDAGPVLDGIDALLAASADRIERTRKGRVWDIWVRGRPVHVWVTAWPPSVCFAAGCNRPDDYAVLRQLAGRLAEALGGLASEPTK